MLPYINVITKVAFEKSIASPEGLEDCYRGGDGYQCYHVHTTYLKEDAALIVALFTDAGDDSPVAPVHVIQLVFDRAEWAAFKAFVDAQWEAK